MNPSDLTTPDALEPDDSDLIARVRAGDLDAYAVLYGRHRDAALKVARGLAGPVGADDLVAEAFLRTLRLLLAGRGPDQAFRGYVLTAVRNTYYTVYKRALRIVPVEDITTITPEQSTPDPSQRVEDELVSAALASLPPRWQQAIRLTTIEELPLEEVARRLGTSSGAAAQLAFRAREALRVAYLEQHARRPEDELCRAVVPLIARNARATAPARGTRIEKHLADCSPCRAASSEILQVAGTIRPGVRTRSY